MELNNINARHVYRRLWKAMSCRIACACRQEPDLEKAGAVVRVTATLASRPAQRWRGCPPRLPAGHAVGARFRANLFEGSGMWARRDTKHEAYIGTYLKVGDLFEGCWMLTFRGEAQRHGAHAGTYLKVQGRGCFGAKRRDTELMSGLI